MLSTLFESQIYLGFSRKQPIQQKTHEQSFLGGQPIFLYEPHPSLLQCQECNKQKLTFICQIFCPLELQRCYNRCLYVFYCQKCYTQFRAIKQQAASNFKIQKIQTKTRVISQKSYEIDSQGFQVKQLMKILHRCKNEVEEQIRQERQQQQFDDDEQQLEGQEKQIEMMGGYEEMESYNNKNSNSLIGSQLQKQQFESLKQVSQTFNDKKEQKDQVFEQYKKIMLELDGPILLYSNVPIPYNSQPVNNKHFCKYCNSKLILELQLTQKILLASQKLVGMDWGSLMVFTCSSSCEKSIDECVVVQFQVDAIKNSQINLLKKSKKNKKKKERKQNNKNKSRSKSKDNKTGQQLKIEKVITQKQQENQQGDWD